ncbi:TlpA disulfide reductase family protein [Desertivirga arenae]|uniref:TlpA disulfide reductase family protein n=1 Tax=Desertivirga arenae TaxID=2810309 RepID=UPI001A95E3F3|nr:TlpA disulfide reductase family protein [Pedobacter sp. SYSU D00823]
MKTKIFKGAAIAAALFVASTALAQKNSSTDSLRTELENLLNSKEASSKSELNTRLATLAASKNEREMILAANYYYRLNNIKTSDSIVAEQTKKFPLGIRARSIELQKISTLKTAAEMEKAFIQALKKFPPQKFATGGIDDGIEYDYVIAHIAQAYATEKNPEKATKMINQLYADFWKGNAYSGLTQAFYKAGDLARATKYAKLAMENAESYTNDKKGNSNAARFAASGYPGLTSTYANMLFEQKNYSEALIYTEKAYKSAQGLNPGLNYRYATILSNLNRNEEAYAAMEQVVKAGKASPEMGDLFKALYIKVKGSDAGFSDYASALRKSYLEDLNKRLAKEKVSEKAPGFNLTDINGKSVSLEELKGKVVILDFWATWCGPCKASFPAMQMAVNKYKNDPNVKFLFIHTWERGGDATKDAKDYVLGNKYTFDVLMDLKDPQTKANKVVSSYKVNGIPAKFVIDGAGNIRYKLTGFDGSNEAAVDELSAMIESISGNTAAN